MFNLIRRISYGVIPRPDRPWADDATSNAPQKGRKRRLSSTDREQDPDAEESAKKKVRGESVASSIPDSSRVASPQMETAEVKFVTQGVKQVEITDEEPAVVAPEEVPLPEEQDGELDEPAAATPSQETQEEYVEDTNDDIASSTNGDAEESTPGTVVAEESEPSDKEKEKEVTVSAAARDDQPSALAVVDPEDSKKPNEHPDDHAAEKEDAPPHDD